MTRCATYCTTWIGILVRAVGVTAANVPEARVTADLDPDLVAQHATLAELQINRAYLTSHWVRERDPALAISCKAWPVPNHRGFPKTAFTFDWEKQVIHCPNEIAIPFQTGQTVHFPEDDCAAVPSRSAARPAPADAALRFTATNGS